MERWGWGNGGGVGGATQCCIAAAIFSKSAVRSSPADPSGRT